MRCDASVPAAARGGGSGQSPLVYAAIGIGGLAVVMLGIVLVVMLTRGGGEPVAKAVRTGGGCPKTIRPETSDLSIRLTRVPGPYRAIPA